MGPIAQYSYFVSLSRPNRVGDMSGPSNPPHHKSRKPRANSRPVILEEPPPPSPSSKKQHAPAPQRKARSKSLDHCDVTAPSTGTTDKKKRTGSKRNASLGKLSLEASLSRMSGPSLLQRQDFGRGADDDDTFCGSGTVDGEVKRGKLNLKSTTTTIQNPLMSRPLGGGRGALSSSLSSSDPFGGLGRRRSSDDDDDSESDDEVDFFANSSNPFKDIKKKTPATKRIPKRTTAL